MLGNKYFDCTWNTGGANDTTQTCPFPGIKLYDSNHDLYFTLRDSDGFHNDLLDNCGIDAHWIKFDDKVLATTQCSVSDI